MKKQEFEIYQKQQNMNYMNQINGLDMIDKMMSIQNFFMEHWKKLLIVCFSLPLLITLLSFIFKEKGGKYTIQDSFGNEYKTDTFFVNNNVITFERKKGKKIILLSGNYIVKQN